MPNRAGSFALPTELDLRALASFDAGDDAAVLTLYLDTDGRRLPRRTDVERVAADALRELRAERLDRPVRDGVEADIIRIREYVERELDRSGVQGLAIFACHAKGLWNVHPLPASAGTRASLDRHPHVLRLESLVARAETFGTALVSRDKARFFLTRLGSTQETAGVVDDVPGQHAQGGWSQANFQRHVGEIAARHLRHVADELFALTRKTPIDHLVLAGPDDAVTIFEKSLHTYLQERIAGRISLKMSATLREVQEATRQVEDKLERERSSDAVVRVLEEFAAGRNAVVGMDATLQALLDGRVDVLAVQDGQSRAGFKCVSCSRLAVVSGDCPSCAGSLHPVADLHEEMVDEALAQRCRVVTDQTRPLPEGVGALLRF